MYEQFASGMLLSVPLVRFSMIVAYHFDHDSFVIYLKPNIVILSAFSFLHGATSSY